MLAYRTLEGVDTTMSGEECHICCYAFDLESRRQVHFSGCAHSVCMRCIQHLTLCPYCRLPISDNTPRTQRSNNDHDALHDTPYLFGRTRVRQLRSARLEELASTEVTQQANVPRTHFLSVRVRFTHTRHRLHLITVPLQRLYSRLIERTDPLHV